MAVKVAVCSACAAEVEVPLEHTTAEELVDFVGCYGKEPDGPIYAVGCPNRNARPSDGARCFGSMSWVE